MKKQYLRILSLVSRDILANKDCDAGSQKVYNLYLYLSKQLQVEVIDFVPIKSQSKETCVNANFRIVPMKAYVPSLFYNLGKLKVPYQLAAYKFYSLYGHLMGDQLSCDYDYIIFDSFILAGLLGHIPDRTRTIYSSHNVEHEWYKEEAKSFFFQKMLLKMIFDIERRLLKRSDMVFAVSEQDKAAFQSSFRCDASKIKVVPLGHNHGYLYSKTTPDPKLFEKFGLDASKKRAMFCGSNFYANQIAVDALIQHVLPRLDSDVEMVVIGSVSEYIAARYSPYPVNLRLLGFVESVTEAYSVCDVALNPVMCGGGANMKMIDYLGFGLDVITTEFGMRGYESLRANVHVCDINSMANAVNAFLRAPTSRLTDAILEFHWSSIAEKTAGFLLESLAVDPAPCRADSRIGTSRCGRATGSAS